MFHLPVMVPVPASISLSHTAWLASRKAVSCQRWIGKDISTEQRTSEIVAERRVSVWLDPGLVEDGVCMQRV